MTTYRADPERPGITYGPHRSDRDEWVLSINTTGEDRVEIVLDEDAMYELWTEVHNVPWPREPDPKGRLVREIVERINGLDSEGCRTVLDTAKEVSGEKVREGSR